MTTSSEAIAREYARIEEEVSRLASTIASAPAHVRCVLAALMQHQADLPIVEDCPYCHSTLMVTVLGETAWQVHCSCGKVENTFRGL